MHATNRATAAPLLLTLALCLPPLVAGAQQVQPVPVPKPAAAGVPPEDLEPRVNTSAMPAQAPAPGPAAAATPDQTGAGAPGAGAPIPGEPRPTGKSTAIRGGKPAGKDGKAQDHLQLDTTDITGNRELPKVLYIVPWKRSDLGDLGGKPLNSLVDEALEPVDRDVFNRENRYYHALAPQPGPAAGAAGAAPAAAGTSAAADGSGSGK